MLTKTLLNRRLVLFCLSSLFLLFSTFISAFGLDDNWYKNDFFPGGSNVYRMYAMKSGSIFICTNYGLLISRDHGETARVAETGLPFEYQCQGVVENGKGTLYGAFDRDGVYKSTDDGESWTSILSNLPKNLNAFSIYYDTLQQEIFLGTFLHGVHTSSDDGATWTYFSKVLDIDASQKRVWDITTSKEGYVFEAVSYNMGIYRTMDRGTSWARMDNGFNHDDLFRTARFDPDGNLWALNYPRGVMAKSTKSGASWVEMGAPFTRTGKGYGSGICFQPGGTIYITTTLDGIYYSANGGNSWVREVTNADVDYWAACCIGKDGYVYACTLFGELYRKSGGPFSSTDVQEVLENVIEVYQSSDGDLIQIHSTNEPIQRVRIVDMNGQFQSNMSNSIEGRGVTFDTSSLVQGAYFILVTTAKETVCKKLLIRKF